MGDSYGVRSYSNGDIYATRLAAKLNIPLANASQYGWTNGDILNGRSGSSSQLQTLLGSPLVADPDALYIVWAGFNDVYFGDDPAPIDLNQSIANMRTIFDQLADAGARYLMVPSILDVGRWPVAGPYQDSLSLRTRVYNAKLELLIEEIAAQGNLRFIAPAIYDGAEYIMEAPGSFGYSYTTELCEDYVDVSYSNGNPIADCSGYFFWDSAHVTDTVHAAIATEMERLLAVAANPEPAADSDFDGRPDSTDAFPFDPLEQLDSDRDGVGNNTDAFPSDPTETMDSDGDGIGDNTDVPRYALLSNRPERSS